MKGFIIFLFILIFLSGCTSLSVSRDENWGIYSLNLDSKKTDLIFSSPVQLRSLNAKGSVLAFEMNEEIYLYNKTSKELIQLTNNSILDVYPAISPDGLRMAYLSMNNTLSIRVMNINGSNDELLYDSGFHDSDINWVEDKIVFTKNSQIWLMSDSGLNAKMLTNYSRAGQWGRANLPFGDYDPRISPDGSKIVFSRLINDSSIHGDYDLYLVSIDGSNEFKLTDTGYAQGLSSWSPCGTKIIYIVAAINDSGVFDIYSINADGTNNEKLTPDYFPENFLVHNAIFYSNNSLYFIGQWWE